jgi:hypothetical protein
MKHIGAVDILDGSAVLHVWLIGLLFDELRGIQLGHHNHKSNKEYWDEYFKDVAAHAALVQNPILAHEGSEFTHQNVWTD